MTKVFLALCLICHSAWEFSTIAQTNNVSNLSDYERLDSNIASFETNKLVERLETTITAIDANEINLTKQQQIKLWFHALSAIDKHLDVNYGSAEYIKTNLVSVNLCPPDPKYPSGIDPSEISEPEVRAKYEAMLKINAERNDYNSFQSQLYSLDKDIESDTSDLVKSFVKSESDRTELINILNATLLSKERKQKILALLP